MRRCNWGKLRSAGSRFRCNLLESLNKSFILGFQLFPLGTGSLFPRRNVHNGEVFQIFDKFDRCMATARPLDLPARCRGSCVTSTRSPPSVSSRQNLEQVFCNDLQKPIFLRRVYWPGFIVFENWYECQVSYHENNTDALGNNTVCKVSTRQKMSTSNVLRLLLVSAVILLLSHLLDVELHVVQSSDGCKFHWTTHVPFPSWARIHQALLHNSPRHGKFRD